MKVLRVRHAGQTFYAQLLLEEGAVVCLDKTLGLPEPIPLTKLAVLPPLSPSKVVCVRDNCRTRLARAGRPAPDEPILFFRPPSSVLGGGQDIVLPDASARVEPGCELAVVLGRCCRDIAPGDVPKVLFGYCCANAVTAADLLARDGGPGRATGFDTFTPLGPWIETTVADPSALALRTLRNGRRIQDGTTADLVFSPWEVVSFVSKVMTLLPGDVVLTGGPDGDEGLDGGDEVRVEIDAVGVLINAVRASASVAARQALQ
jgi:2-keto-4-pentenoate hydratase/2-oxohepta-3-ene-1,7-dioic acid hydratase in catechol pathway